MEAKTEKKGEKNKNGCLERNFLTIMQHMTKCRCDRKSLIFLNKLCCNKHIVNKNVKKKFVEPGHVVCLMNHFRWSILFLQYIKVDN